MENASKALIIAGSILMSILVIGVFTLAYRQMSAVEQARIDTEEASKVVDYGRQFEQYNKTIYGSELLSLGNLKLDYNRIQAEMKTYEPINIYVRFTNNVEEETVYIAQGRRSIEEIRTGIRSLENEIATYENVNNGKRAPKDRILRSVKTYAQYNNRQLADLFELPFSSDDGESVIMDKLIANHTTKTLLDEIDKYKNLKTLLTTFKRKQFSVKNMRYGDTGRIVQMEYEEI